MSTTTINNQVINLSAENIKLLKEYKQEAYGYFADVETAQQGIKDVLEAASDKTGIDKKLIKQFYTLSYKAKTTEFLEQAAVIEVLNN